MGGVVAYFVGRVLDVAIAKPAPFGEAPASPDAHAEPWDDDLAILRLEIAELRAEVGVLTGRTRGLRRAAAAPTESTVQELDHEEW